MKQIYAVYRGDDYLFDGSAEEVADYLKVKIETVRKMATPSYQTRTQSGITVVKLNIEDGNDEKSTIK